MESHYMQGLDWVILGIYFAVLIARFAVFGRTQS